MTAQEIMIALDEAADAMRALVERSDAADELLSQASVEICELVRECKRLEDEVGQYEFDSDDRAYLVDLIHREREIAPAWRFKVLDRFAGIVEGSK